METPCCGPFLDAALRSEVITDCGGLCRRLPLRPLVYTQQPSAPALKSKLRNRSPPTPALTLNSETVPPPPPPPHGLHIFGGFTVCIGVAYERLATTQYRQAASGSGGASLVPGDSGSGGASLVLDTFPDGQGGEGLYLPEHAVLCDLKE